jgi:two-component system cell cycle sensor histidine kinase/response regulator CckA
MDDLPDQRPSPAIDEDDLTRAERLLRESLEAHERTERILREAEERLQRAVSAGNIGLWDWNVTTGEVYFSPAVNEQLGFPPDGLRGHVDAWRERIHPDDAKATSAAVQAHLDNPDIPYDCQFRLRHKDGSYRTVLARGHATLDENGRPVRMLGSQVDITERVAIETQLRLAQRMEGVGRLAGGIAHDFNNALTVINNYAEMVIEGLPDNDPQLDRALTIRRAGGRAAQLTQQLLAFSRQQTLKPVILNLRAIVDEMAPMLRRLIGEDIELLTTGDADVSCVNADPSQVDQVIMNLVVNARDAMPDGGQLTIDVANRTLDASHGNERVQVQPGPYVQLRVSDTGLGMTQSTRDRIFEPFFTTKEMGKGTGLGLPTVYGIVKQSGGYIFVDSDERQGSTFRVYLPAVAGVPESHPSIMAGAPPRGSETLLIVEDDKDVRVLTALIATAAGYKVLTASSGAEALNLVAGLGEPVDLVLTDVIMPGMNGRRLAEQVTERWPGTRLLFMSGYIDDQTRIMGPGEQFISKPFTRGALLRKIRELLDA